MFKNVLGFWSRRSTKPGPFYRTYRDPRVNSQQVSSAQLRVFAYCLLYYVLTVGNNTIMIARPEKPIERSEFPYCTLGVISYYVQ